MPGTDSDPLVEPTTRVDADERAQEVFTQWLAHHESPTTGDLDRLKVSHPELAAELHELFEEWGVAWRMLRNDIAVASPDVRSVAPSHMPPREHAYERYADKEEIGRDGMTSLRRVWDEDLNRHLVLRVLDLDGVDATAKERERARGLFVEEARLIGQLNHPAIPSVYDIGEDPKGRVFFTMPLLEGRAFDEIIAAVHDSGTAWSMARALGVFLKAAEAVGLAHSRGVVHRRLEPSAIRVGDHGETYVLNWGLARVYGRGELRDIRLRSPTATTGEHGERRTEEQQAPLETMDGEIVGTPVYMAPEQAAGCLEDVGPASDIYSLGAVLYHVLTGQPPYTQGREAASAQSQLMMVLQGPPPAARRVRRRIPRSLAAICQRAMERCSTDRYGEVDELVRDVEAFLDDRPVNAAPPSMLRPVTRLARRWLRH